MNYQLILAYGLILIPILILIGIILRKMPFIPPWIIPCILFVIGPLLGCLIFGWNMLSFILGFLCAGTALSLHQLFEEIYKNCFKCCDRCEPCTDEDVEV